jgi:hypothetical protein
MLAVRGGDDDWQYGRNITCVDTALSLNAGYRYRSEITTALLKTLLRVYTQVEQKSCY